MPTTLPDPDVMRYRRNQVEHLKRDLKSPSAWIRAGALDRIHLAHPHLASRPDEPIRTHHLLDTVAREAGHRSWRDYKGGGERIRILECFGDRTFARWLDQTERESNGTYLDAAAGDAATFQVFVSYLRADAEAEGVDATDEVIGAHAWPIWKRFFEAEGACVCGKAEGPHEHCSGCETVLDWTDGLSCSQCSLTHDSP